MKLLENPEDFIFWRCCFAICLWTEERTTMPGEEGASLDIRAVSLKGENIEMPDRAKIPYQLESGHGKI